MKKVSSADLTKISTTHGVGKKIVFISKDEIPFVKQFAQAILSPGETVDAHIHEEVYEIFLVERGRGVLSVNDITYNIQEGDCITIEPNELHGVSNNGDSDLILTYFSIQSGNR